MRRYFFHLNHLRECVQDPEGAEFPNLEAAKSDARQELLELAAQDIKPGALLMLWSIRICNEQGALLAEVTTNEALRHPEILKATPGFGQLH
jgi:hypothetical protein